MKVAGILAGGLAAGALLLSAARPALASASLDLYGTFHAMGVVVTIAATDDPNGNAVPAVSYRRGTSGSFAAGFPLSRVDATRFVGSLFWLRPGTAYEVKVAFSDPDNDPLDGITVQSAAATRPEIALPVPTRSRHVSPAGSGTVCSEAAPCALREGLNRAQPGEEVVLRGGVYRDGGIALPRSGAAGAPIVVRGRAGETAVLDGADPAAFAWTAEGGGVYRTSVNVPWPHLLAADGTRLYPYQTLADLQTLTWGIPGFFVAPDGTTVRVRLAGDADPNAAAMVVSRENHAFSVAQDHVLLVDLTFRHYGQGDWAKAVYLDGASDCLVQGCTFALNDLGIGIKRAAHRNVIQDSEFRDTDFDWPWDAVKAGSNLETGGVRFYDPATGRGTVIRRNVFHDYFDGLGVCPETTAAATNETDVYENLVYRAGDDGLETDGRCSNVRIWGNTFHDVLIGISLAPAGTGPVYAIRNLIYRTGAGNSIYTGSPFKFNSGGGPSGPMYLFHNTADAALPGSHGLDIKSPGAWSMIHARNNVWSGTASALANNNAAQPVDLDHDALWNGGGADLVRWGGARYATLAAFSASTAQERHGLGAAPRFVAPGAGDYALSPASPLIDAGVPIPGVSLGWAGAAPDIGAFESRPSIRRLYVPFLRR